ncbi:hypothetical protein M9458_051629, partial [Cirrhinus mrigala]
MINFDQEKLPEKVYIGFMCYDVRLYIPPPIRCFKCQRYGHVAAVCKGKQRCGKCSGEHDVVIVGGNTVPLTEDVRLVRGRPKCNESRLFRESVMQKLQRRFQGM